VSKFRITVNGREQKNWLSVSLSRSIDELCGQFSFRTSFRPEYPILRNDVIQIYIDGELKLTGYQDRLEGLRTARSKTRSINGRDLTQDIVDSNVPAEAANQEGGTLKELAEIVVKALGMKIRVLEDIDEALEPFESFSDEGDTEACAIDDKAFDFLKSFARKRQAYLITSPAGDLVIYRPNDRTKISNQLLVDTSLENQYVREVTFTKDFASEFSKITCGSQDELLHSTGAEDDTSIIGEVEVPGIRQSRQRQIISEEAFAVEECVTRATEEANILKMRSQTYQCKVDGTLNPDGNPWEIGQHVQIVDAEFGVRGAYMLKSYSMSLDLQGGSSTVLTFVRPTSYQPFADVPAYSKRKTKFEPEQVDATTAADVAL
jgi:prophage tail gpP-like protein